MLPPVMADHSASRPESAPAVTLPSLLKAGDVIGAYQVDAVIQRGGMGEVFLVSPLAQPAGADQVVLKRLPLASDDEDGYAAMFRTEIEVMSRFEHPNIVSVLDSFETASEICLALEFVRGRNLMQVQRGCAGDSIAIPPGVGLHLMIQVLEGLHYAHTFELDDGQPLGLVHRDITPGNVLIGFDGQVKLTDFGISKSAMSRAVTRVGVVKGTTRYLSPEQIRASELTPKSDVFSAAVVLTELLTGKPLFDRGAVAPTLFAIVNQERPDVAGLLPFEAPELSKILENALSTDLDRRPPSAKAFADELRWAAQVQGWTETRPDVRLLMQRLFPEAVSAPDRVPSTIKTSAPRLDLTYLLEVSEPDPAAGGAHIEEELRALLQGMVAGSAPLDASQFDSVPSVARVGAAREVPKTEPTGPRAGPPPPPPRENDHTPADVRSRDILDALDHVSSEIDALEKKPVPPPDTVPNLDSEPATVRGLRRTPARWPRELMAMGLGDRRGIGCSPAGAAAVGAFEPGGLAPRCVAGAGRPARNPAENRTRATETGVDRRVEEDPAPQTCTQGRGRSRPAPESRTGGAESRAGA